MSEWFRSFEANNQDSSVLVEHSDWELELMGVSDSDSRDS